MPSPTATPTVEVPLPPEKLPYVFINKVTYGNVTAEVTDKLTSRSSCPANVYPHSPDDKVPCAPLQGVALNTERFPDAERMLNDGILYALYVLAWQNQRPEDIPDRQIALIFSDQDSEDAKHRKFEELKGRISQGESFTVQLFGYVDDGTEAASTIVDLGWKYHVDILDRPSTMVTWHTQAKGGLRFEPTRHVIRFEQYHTGHGSDSRSADNMLVAQELVVLLAYLPKLVANDGGLPGLDVSLPTVGYQSTIQRDNFTEIAQYFMDLESATSLDDLDSILLQVR